MKKITLLLVLLLTASFGYSQDPTTTAPTPTSAAIDVISVYSDAYTSIATNLNPSWGQATTQSEIVVSSDHIIKYANLNYQGTEYTNPTDVSAMEYVHLDYYTTDATAFQFFLIAGGENAYDVAATDGITTGQWVGIDIPLSFYVEAGRNLTAAFQFKTVGNGTLYLDNIYFWKNPAAAGTDASLSALTVDGDAISGFGSLTTSYAIELAADATTVPTVVATPTDGSATTQITNASSLPGATTILVTAQDGITTNTVTINFTLDPTPATAAPAPTQNSADVISVYSDTYSSNATNLNPGWGQATTFSEIQISSNNLLKYANLNYQGMEYTSSDVSAMEYIHLDYHTNDATALQFFLIAGGENGYDIAATDGITTGQWVGIDIPLSFYSNAGRNLAAAIQFKTVGNGTIFLDNIYFWRATVDPLTDATLTDIQIDSETVSGFSSAELNYDVVLPKGTTSIPQITTATKSQSGANAVITQATQLPGDATVVVTSEDTNTVKTYTISFSVDTNTPCEGNSTESQQGEFAVGYNYSFETLGNGDVRISFELLDDVEGIVGFLWEESPFSETGMTNTSGSIYSADVSGKTNGEVISFGCKFAWAGSFGITKYFSYTVGDTCSLGLNDYKIEGLETYPNPTNNQWFLSTKDQIMKSIEVYNILGERVLSLHPNSSSATVDASNLTSGMYISKITTALGSESKMLIKN
ncbi:T9SS type A sorting domain-containing protein [Flavicella sediminum]|uniref:T9SS type A sorting domain-containing protein n=1 Tax=Flavicella sediminum TaxID=2585141 RepID=UPI00111F9B8F|nr:T9SS type A sorting domain-containing protein [Flavicella sediminum]